MHHQEGISRKGSSSHSMERDMVDATSVSALCCFVRQRLEHVLFGSDSDDSRDQIRDLISAGEALGMDFPTDLARLLAVKALEWKIQDQDAFDLDWISLIQEAFPLTDASNWPLIVDARTQTFISMLASSPGAPPADHFDELCEDLFPQGFSEFKSNCWGKSLAARRKALQCSWEIAASDRNLHHLQSEFKSEDHLMNVKAAIEQVKKGLSVDMCLAKHRSALQQAGFTVKALSELELKPKCPGSEISTITKQALAATESLALGRVARAEESRPDAALALLPRATNDQVIPACKPKQMDGQGVSPDVVTWSCVTTPRNPTPKLLNQGTATPDLGDPFKTPIANRRSSSQCNPITPVCQHSPGVPTVLTPGPGKAQQQGRDQQKQATDGQSRIHTVQQIKGGAQQQGGQSGRAETRIGNGLTEEQPWEPSALGQKAAIRQSTQELKTVGGVSRGDAGHGQSTGRGFLGSTSMGGWATGCLATVEEETSPSKEAPGPTQGHTFAGSLGKRNNRGDTTVRGFDQGGGPSEASARKWNDAEQGHPSSRITPAPNPKPPQPFQGLKAASGNCPTATGLDEPPTPPVVLPAEQVIKKYLRLALANPDKKVYFPTLVPGEMKEASLRAKRVFEKALKRIKEAKKKQQEKDRGQGQGQQRQVPRSEGGANPAKRNTVGVAKHAARRGDRSHRGSAKRNGRVGESKTGTVEEVSRKDRDSNLGREAPRWNPSGTVEYTPRGGLGMRTDNKKKSRIPQRPSRGKGPSAGGTSGANDLGWHRVKQTPKDSAAEGHLRGTGDQNATKDPKLPKSYNLTVEDISVDFSGLQHLRPSLATADHPKAVRVDHLHALWGDSEMEHISGGTNHLPPTFSDRSDHPKQMLMSVPVENESQAHAATNRNQALVVPLRFKNTMPADAASAGHSSQAPRAPFFGVGDDRRIASPSNQPRKRGSTPMTDLAKLKEMAFDHQREAQ